MKRITILFLTIALTLFLIIPSLALTKKERAWKKDILTLLPLVKRVGDYSEVVNLIEVAPALKEDPEIRKAFVTFAPPGATPPEWAKEEKKAPSVQIEVPEKIATAETIEKVSRWESEQVSREEKEERARAEEARRIAREVAAQKKIQKREVAPPEIIVTAEAARKALEEQRARQKEKERRKREEEIKEELGVRPTPLPKGAKVIHSTDVVSGVQAEMVGGQMRVTIALSGERGYKVSERSRPPSIVINIPHTINAVAPGTIPINKGCLRTIKVIQHRCFPVAETRITVILNRWTEYQVTHRNNEIYIDFEE